jgi:CheY-like chemotaxis protein
MTDNYGHLLVVDDHKSNRLKISAAIKKLGYTIEMAEDGRQALAMLRMQPFDLVLLDIMMPELDGYQVLEQMKADSALRDIPVIIISAEHDLDSVAKGIELGAEDYLSKSFDRTLLKARINASLEKKKLRDQEVAYLRQVKRLTVAATKVEAGTFDPDSLSDLAERTDALGQLTRLFQWMIREFYAREQRLKQEARAREEALELQLQQLRFGLDQVQPLLKEAFNLTSPFDFLTAQEQEWLADRALTFTGPDGWLISGPDSDDYDGLFLLLKGQVVMLEREGADGQGIIEAPVYFGERSLFFEQPPALRFVAQGPVQYAVLSGEDIRTLVVQNSMFSQAFATILRNKQRLFHGYETFVNLLFTQVDKGFIQLWDLVEVYRELHPVLHPGSFQSEPDFNALGYVIPRLPESITSAQALVLAESLPKMYQPVREALRSPSQRAKKRDFYDVLPNKILALLRDRTTDTVDLITKLCIYAVEIDKIRERLSDTPEAAQLAQFVIQGGPPAEKNDILNRLPFTPEEMGHLGAIFGEKLLQKLYEVLAQVGDLSIYVPQSDHHYAKSASEQWLAQIRNGLWQVLTPQEFHDDLEVHIISSNTHSVHNCLSSWLNERLETILKWAAEQLPASLELPIPADQLYFAARDWSRAHSQEADCRLEADRANGIYLLDDASFTGIQVRLIDVNQLGARLDPYLDPPALQHRTLIVNIDYAYGQQAELIMRSLILLFGQRIRSISVFGKSGAIVGQRGDLLLPDRLLLQTDDQLYPLPNRDLTPADFVSVGCDQPVHEGTLLTVLGTIMQSREMLYYYRHFWNVIGMEMEGSFYLREILRARSLGLIPNEVCLRFAYYTSDTPLEPHASLASSLATKEGLPPVYAITRAVLRSILRPEERAL